MSESRLDKLAHKKAQLENQIKALQAKEAAKQRKDDTRRKIIAGALALEHTKQHGDSEFANTLGWLLDTYVTRPHERRLFGLSALDPVEAARRTEAASKAKMDFAVASQPR